MQTRRHFFWFHPEAADLDLLVGAAKVAHVAIGLAQRQVTAAVHACTRLGGERVGHEALGRQPRLAQVTPCQAAPPDIQLALGAGGHRQQPGRSHLHVAARQGTAQQHRLACRQFGGEHPYRCFGGAVVVDHRQPWRNPGQRA
ncbi:hypothetical protein D3C76_894540 [compost metagenome]